VREAQHMRRSAFLAFFIASLMLGVGEQAQGRQLSSYSVSGEDADEVMGILQRMVDIDPELDPEVEAKILAGLYEEAREVSAGAALSIAFRAADSLKKAGRIEDAAHWFGVAAAEGRREDASAIEKSPSVVYGLMQGEMLIRLGRTEDAAEAMLAADHSTGDPYMRYQLLMNASHYFASVGRREDSASTMLRAVEHIRASDQGTLAEEISALQFVVDHGPLNGERDLDVRVAGYLEIHNDERFRDSPARLDLISRPMVHDAMYLQEWDLLDDLSEEVLADVMRLTRGMDAEWVSESGLDEVYMQTSFEWAEGLMRQRRSMEAVEVLEAAMEAFPGNRLAPHVKSSLARAYGEIGVDLPDKWAMTDAELAMHTSRERSGRVVADPVEGEELHWEWEIVGTVERFGAEADISMLPSQESRDAPPPPLPRPAATSGRPASSSGVTFGAWMGVGAALLLLLGVGAIWRAKG
jgi:tetratricopeptide (TPR) repeat protein